MRTNTEIFQDIQKVYSELNSIQGDILSERGKNVCSKCAKTMKDILTEETFDLMIGATNTIVEESEEKFYFSDETTNEVNKVAASYLVDCEAALEALILEEDVVLLHRALDDIRNMMKFGSSNLIEGLRTLVKFELFCSDERFQTVVLTNLDAIASEYGVANRTITKKLYGVGAYLPFSYLEKRTIMSKWGNLK